MIDYNILTAAEKTKDLSLDYIDLWKNSDTSIKQSTSGSTGRPKVITIPKWKMEASARLTGSFFDLANCSNSLICISPAFIGGKMMLVRSLLYNLTMTFAPITSNPIKDLDHPIDFAAMVPLQVSTILRENPEKLNYIKYLIIGGAPTSNELAANLRKTSVQAFATFGMTETVSHIALQDLREINAPFQGLGDTLFSTKEDCLVINNVALQLDNLVTNDCVELLNDKHFHWLGRKDFVINSGGIKLHPEKLEAKIKSLLPSSSYFFSSQPDELLGEQLILIIEGKENRINPTVLKKKLSNIELPKQVYTLASFSYTESGKLDRRKTQKMLSLG